MEAAATITATAVGSLVAGAVLGVAYQELFRVVRESKSRCSNFKNALHSLECRIDVLTPLIKEMDRLNQELEDCKREEITRLFLQQLKKAEALVSECPNIHRWNLYKKRKYKKGLWNWILLFKSFLKCSRLDRRLIPSDLNLYYKKCTTKFSQTCSDSPLPDPSTSC